MPSKKSVIKILIFACFVCASFVAEQNNEIQKLNPESINERNPIQGFYLIQIDGAHLSKVPTYIVIRIKMDLINYILVGNLSLKV